MKKALATDRQIDALLYELYGLTDEMRLWREVSDPNSHSRSHCKEAYHYSQVM